MIVRSFAVARYLAAGLALSQAVYVPFVAFAAVLAVLFLGDPGPPPAPWGASTIVAYPVAAWIAIVVANHEPPSQRVVTVAAAGGPGRVLAGTVAVALASDVLLVVLAVLTPVLFTRYPYPPPVLLAGVVGHLATTTAGTAVGLLCARPVVRRTGWTFGLAGVLLVVTAVQPWLPPVGTVVRRLSLGVAAAPVGEALLGLAVVVVAAVIVWRVERGQ